MAHDVFISHSSIDKSIADAVCSILEQNKTRCWIAPRDVTPGKNYAACITEAIKSSHVMVIIFSTNSNASGAVINEIEVATNHNVVIIPLRIENIKPSGELEFYLSTKHWLDAITPPIEEHILKLAHTIQTLIGIDSDGNDAARIAEAKRRAEEVARFEEEKRKTEEAARVAEERRKAEEAARIAEEKRKAEEAARVAEEMIRNKMAKYCPRCGALIDATAASCMYCRYVITPPRPNKRKTTAGILAILLGWSGVHKFYLGKPVWGFLYLISSIVSTLLLGNIYIPAIVGTVEGIIYLSVSEEKFYSKYVKK